MPERWLFKTEPNSYSFDELVREKRTVWDGVKNNAARKNLRAVTRGDQVYIYHTGNEKAVIGVAKAVSGPYQDPESSDPKAVVVDIAVVERLDRPVTLAELKARPDLATFPLVRLPRLSVMPVSTSEWSTIERLATQ